MEAGRWCYGSGRKHKQSKQQLSSLVLSCMHVLASPFRALLTHHPLQTHTHAHHPQSIMESVKAAATFATSNLIRPVRLVWGGRERRIGEEGCV